MSIRSTFTLVIGLTLILVGATGVGLNGVVAQPSESGAIARGEASGTLITRFYEDAWNQGDFMVVDVYVHPRHVAHDSMTRHLPRGATGVKQLITAYRTVFGEFTVTLDDIVATEETVAARFTLRGTHQGAVMGVAPTGASVTVTGFALYRISDGQITESWVQWDALGLTRQVGPSPIPALVPGGMNDTSSSPRRLGEPY